MIKILDIFTEKFELKDIGNILLVLNGVDGYESVQSPTIFVYEKESVNENEDKKECVQGEGEGRKRKRVDINSEKKNFIWKNVHYEYKREIDSLILTCSNVRHISREVFQNDKINIIEEEKNLNCTNVSSIFGQKIKDVFVLRLRDILEPALESKEAKRRKHIDDQNSYDKIIERLIKILS